MKTTAYTIRPVSTRLDGQILPLRQAGGRWDAIQITVLPEAGNDECTGWGLFPMLDKDKLAPCQLLTADERIAVAALDALHGED